MPKKKRNDELSIVCADDNHLFSYGGVKFSIAEPMNAEATYFRRVYYDWFFCRRCLLRRFERLDVDATTLGPIMFDASPLPSNMTAEIELSELSEEG